MKTMSSTKPRQSPLHDLHVKLDGKLVDFAGWLLPVNYPAGILDEHKHCRSKAALFDVSHMGQVELRGDSVANALEGLLPSSIEGLSEGKARYSFFTNADGGIMDDLIVSNAGDHLFVVVNASMREQDIAHMTDNLTGVDVVELTDRALIAVQGPFAEQVVASMVPVAAGLKFMETTSTNLLGAPCRVSRLGYTGEDGYEISIPSKRAIEIASRLLEHDDLMPAGLGARDSLRLEAGLCLYGNDIDATTSPIEAQLGWAIQKRRRQDGGFPGDARILAEIASGPSRKLVGIKPDGRAPARQGVEVVDEDGNLLGVVTSGGFGPSVEGPVSMGYVASRHAEPGTKVNLMIRGKPVPATLVRLPFVQHNYKR